MKTKLLLLFIFFIESINLFGQPYPPIPNTTVIINTPRDEFVNALKFTGIDYTSYEAALKDNLALTAYPNAILIESSSRNYNCHGFVWHVIEGETPPVWLDGYSDLYPYWDGTNYNASYVEVNTIQEATKIAYQVWQQAGKMDHSAIPTNHPDTVISKWADGPLMKHYKEDCQWKFSGYTMKYYKLKVDNIIGSSEICGQETYSIPYLTSTTHIDWDASSLININSSGNGQATASPTTTTDYGYNEYITADVRTVYNNINEGEDVVIDLTTPSKIKSSIHVSSPPSNVQINVPVEPIYGEVEAMIWASSIPGEETFTWEVVSGGEIISVDNNEVVVEAYCPTVRGLKIKVKATNSCGQSAYITRTISVDCSGGINPLGINPNPTSGETVISIELASEKAYDKNIEWDLEVYSSMQILKTKQIKLKSKSTIIQTHGWKEGVYIVRVRYKNEVLTGKLVVKK